MGAFDEAVRALLKHESWCDVSIGKYRRGSWDDLELPGDCTCGVRGDQPFKPCPACDDGWVIDEPSQVRGRCSCWLRWFLRDPDTASKD